MKSRIRFIICSFIFLSLAGLGEHSYTGCPTIKNSRQTEWYGSTNLKEKDSRSFHYTSWLDIPATRPTIKSWSKDYLLCYNQKIRTEIILLSKTANATGYNTVPILNYSYIPRKSVEDPLTSIITTA